MARCPNGHADSGASVPMAAWWAERQEKRRSWGGRAWGARVGRSFQG